MGFNVACVPGPNAMVSVMHLTEDLPALLLCLDPVNMSIQLPTFRDGDRHLANFCRELAREATKLAAEIDPDGEPTPTATSGPRHLLAQDEYDQAGSGR